MAPEVVNENNEYDPFLADVYSLGVTFYFMAKGNIPLINGYNQDSIPLIWNEFFSSSQEIDPHFEKMICQMMSYEPTNRPTISHLISDPLFKFKDQTKIKKNLSIPANINSQSRLKSKSIIYK
jgi:serine/threonine protein kinase